MIKKQQLLVFILVTIFFFSSIVSFEIGYNLGYKWDWMNASHTDYNIGYVEFNCSAFNIDASRWYNVTYANYNVTNQNGTLFSEFRYDYDTSSFNISYSFASYNNPQYFYYDPGKFDLSLGHLQNNKGYECYLNLPRDYQKHEYLLIQGNLTDQYSQTLFFQRYYDLDFNLLLYEIGYDRMMGMVYQTQLINFSYYDDTPAISF